MIKKCTYDMIPVCLAQTSTKNTQNGGMAPLA